MSIQNYILLLLEGGCSYDFGKTLLILSLLHFWPLKAKHAPSDFTFCISFAYDEKIFCFLMLVLEDLVDETDSPYDFFTITEQSIDWVTNYVK